MLFVKYYSNLYLVLKTGAKVRRFLQQTNKKAFCVRKQYIFLTQINEMWIFIRNFVPILA